MERSSRSPNEAFFGVEPGRHATDPRIIWDAAHGRWVGEVAFYSDDLLDDGLVLAVSDGPTRHSAGPSSRSSSATPCRTTHPSRARTTRSSSPTTCSTASCCSSAPTSTRFAVEILAGAGIVDYFCTDPSFVHPRAAEVLSSSNDVHVVMEATAGNMNQWYSRLTSVGDCANFTD